MKNGTWIVAFLACLLFSLSVMAANPTPTPAKKPAKITKFSCVVQGSPSEFPDDLYITNTGNYTQPKGTKIAWKVANKSGTHTLTSDLAPKSGFSVNNAIPGGLQAGTSCVANLKLKLMKGVKLK
ncbi:MAG: hypothetical protein ABIK09_03275 [Pseudomonadota bacterium]